MIHMQQDFSSPFNYVAPSYNFTDGDGQIHQVHSEFYITYNGQVADGSSGAGNEAAIIGGLYNMNGEMLQGASDFVFWDGHNPAIWTLTLPDPVELGVNQYMLTLMARYYDMDFEVKAESYPYSLLVKSAVE